MHTLTLFDVLGQPITEEYRSLLQQKAKSKKNSLSYYTGVQHIKMHN